MRTPLLGLAVAAALATTLTACSSDDDTTGDQTDSSDTPAADDDAAADDGSLPSCSDVWTEGETLPDDYDSCTGDNGTVIVATYYDCDDGRKLIAYEETDPQLWAFYGDTIQAGGADDPAYGAAFDECRP